MLDKHGHVVIEAILFKQYPGLLVKQNAYLKIVLAFDEELDENLGSNISSIFLQNNLLQENEHIYFSRYYEH